MNYYAIRNVNDASLAWSSEYGWTDSEAYDIFPESDREYITLPSDGEWRLL